MARPRSLDLGPLLPLGALALLTACGLEDYDKLLDTGGPSLVGDDGGGDDGDTLPATDTGLQGGSGSGGEDGGSGSGDGSGSGSGEDGGTDDGGTDDGTTEPIELAIDSVWPDYGTTAGGDVITVTGGPFDASAVVRISGETATVSSATETELVVVTPAVAREGLAQVQVETDAGSGRLASAFRYWEDARGAYGMVGIVELSRYTGSYWDGGTPSDLLNALVYFSDPTTVRWSELFAPSLDTCRSETWTGAPAVTVFDPSISTLSLQPNSGSTLSLPYDGLGFSAEPTSLTAGGTYDLLAPGGLLPAEDVPGVLRLPSSGPTVTAPAISSSIPPDISQYQTFRWTPIGADWVLIAMVVDNGTTSDGYEAVYCPVVDDGAFTFDGSQFALWPTNTVAIVTVGFVYDQTTTPLPWNQGTSAVAGMVSTVGGGFTY